MDHTQEQKNAFVEEFARRKKRQFLIAIPFSVILIVLSLDETSDLVVGIPSTIRLPVFVLLCAGMVFFSWKNWRCPACDRYLGKGFTPGYCPKCGVPLKAQK
jgi:hypothetical protein